METLGLRPSREVEGALFYEGEGSTGFLLFPSGARPSGQHTQMAWFVKDIVASVAKLKGRGVRFEEYDFPGPQEHPWHRRSRLRKGRVVPRQRVQPAGARPARLVGRVALGG